MKRLGRMLGRGIATRMVAGSDSAIEALFEAMPPSLVVRADGAVLRSNNAAVQLFPEAPHCVPLEALFLASARSALRGAVSSAFAARTVSECAVPPLSLRVHPLTEADGTVGAVLVQVVSVAASVDQLAAGQRLQALGQLVGGIAHDFNNLLTIIGAAADAALAQANTVASETARISEAVARGADLARRLLAFGRQQALQPRGVDVQSAVRATADLLGRLIGPRIRVDLEFEDGGRAVHIDPTQLDQVLLNLALNARDAMPQGGCLTLATDHVTLLHPLAAVPDAVPAGRWITIAVTDTGTGIPAEILPRIFEPYFTTRSVQAGSSGGTGLGLATVYGILRQSGGYLTVATASSGTTMTVYLPRSDQKVEARPVANSSTTLAAGGGRTVLLVEDEDLIRNFAERVLTVQGWHVLAAASGEEALDLLDNAPPLAAVVSDMVMPGMDGAALVHAVRCQLGVADLPALMVSGYAPEHQREAMAGLNAAFLAKPYAMQDLVERLGAIARTPAVTAQGSSPA